MPKLLSHYIHEISKETDISSEQLDLTYQNLINALSVTTPTYLNVRCSPFFYDVFERLLSRPGYQSHDALALKGILGKCFGEISLDHINAAAIVRCANQPATLTQAKQMEKIQQRHFLLKHALLFSVTKIGNCSDRAAYASLILFNLLKDTGIKIALQSLKARDQFYVCLGSVAKGWYIYDPLTNPTLLFSVEEYQQTMLQYLPLYTAKKCPYKLILDQAVYNQFVNQLNGVAGRVHHVLSQYPPDQLWADPLFQQYLQTHRITKNTLICAFEHLCSLSSLENGVGMSNR